ncbi:TonB-dependent siderophore receptor, partial [Variovorax sp. HJSM1_2]|uniref:TonB-dependent siderophore receptor n=1 Tax=Variovorax sp. HJSM1_2 TaxID=3366263 RepID=UPI003BD4FD50
GGPLNQAGTLRGRLIGAWQDNDSFVDRLHEKKEVLAGIVEADVASGTLLSAGFSLQNHDSTGLARSGLPLFNADGSLASWAREKSAAANWAYTTRHNQSVFASVDQRLANDWNGKLVFTHSRHQYDEMLGYAANGYADPATGAGIGLWSTRFAGNPTQDSVDATLGGPFTAFGRRHDLAFGLTTSRTKSDEASYGRWFFDGWDGSIANIYTWDGNTPSAPPNPQQGHSLSTERTHSGFASLRLKPSDALSVLAGARATRWTYDINSFDLTGANTSSDSRSADKITPYAALVVDLDKRWSVYASYTTVFKPQSYAKDETGQLIAPEEGKGFEIGTKAALLDEQLNFSAAIYQTKLDNVAEWVRDDIYRAIQGVKTKGFEFELSGALARNWQASVGFSRNLSRDGNDQPVNTDVPKNNLKLYTTYKLPDVGGGLTLGGGVRWQNLTYSDGRGPNGERFEQGAYAVADVMLRYAFNRNVEATLNINNLFDRHYYTSATSAYSGAPRNVMAGLRWKI